MSDELTVDKNGDLLRRGDVLRAIVHHVSYYDDHYMHCLTKCLPELIEKMPAANSEHSQEKEQPS